MDIRVIKETVRENIESIVLDKLDLSVSVIFANQNAPRPDGDYITLLLMNIPYSGQDWTGAVNALTGKRTRLTDMDLLYSVQCISDDAVEILHNLRSELLSEESNELFMIDGISINDIGEVRDITAILGTDLLETRAIMEIRTRMIDEKTEDVGYIESAEVGGNILDAEGNETVVNIDIDSTI